VDAGVADRPHLDEIWLKANGSSSSLPKGDRSSNLASRRAQRVDCLLEQVMFSGSESKPWRGKPKCSSPRKRTARSATGQTIAIGIRLSGQRLPKALRGIAMRCLRHFGSFLCRSYLIAYGEENRDWGGAFAVYRGLTEAFRTTGYSTRRLPRAIVGTAVGYALEGARAGELMYCDFMGEPVTRSSI